MAFAKDYKEEITLGYYCFNLVLTIAVFTFGTIFLRHRDKRDQQRKEWRQFAERIYSEYSKLKDKDIPRRISKVRGTFEKIQINSATTGLDVLRYMLAEGNYDSFKTIQLECLREDLQLIFPLFNVCSSLLLLGKVPKNVKEELKDVISDLGKMAVPFFKGKQRKVILKCLEHFSTDRPEEYRPERETERRIREVDAGLEQAVPYVKSCLIFGTPKGSSSGQQYVGSLHHREGTLELENTHGYSKCSNFSLYVNGNNLQGSDFELITFLQGLHKDLEDPRYLAGFARELRKKPPVGSLSLIELINHLDTDERVVKKVLHEVRVYIHMLLIRSQQQDQIRANVTRLWKVQEEVTKFRPTETIVKGICERFMFDLEIIQASQYHCNSEEFSVKLGQLFGKLREIQNIPPAVSGNNRTSLPSTSQVANKRQETIL